LIVGAGASYALLNFDNTPATGGGTIVQSIRDRSVTTEFIDAGYEFRAGYSIFGHASWNQREYNRSVSSFRDSTGYRYVGGLRADITNLISAEAFGGAFSQDYKGFSTADGGIYGFKLAWSPTPLTGVAAWITQTIEETNEVGASGFLATNTGFAIDHEVTRLISLHLGAQYTNNDFRGIARQEDIYNFQLGADYEVLRYVRLGAAYRYTTRDSSVTSADHNRSEFLVSLRAAR
jgi:hypothetical protein